MKLVYNVPFEVTSVQYDHLMTAFCGAVAGRFNSTTKKYEIKLWLMKYSKQILNYLK